MIPLILYVSIFVGSFFVIRLISEGRGSKDYTSLKTVTFGDESAVRSNRVASFMSILTVFFMWATFTGSSLIPSFLHMPGPFEGNTTFEYTAENAAGERDTATVAVLVRPQGETADKPEIEAGDGFAKNDAAIVNKWGTAVIGVQGNDEAKKKEGAKVVEINGQPVELYFTTDSKDGTIRIKVVDQGIGISKEDLDQIYFRFFRGKNVESIEGTGIGMSIVKRALDAWGGDINIFSELNSGTSVTVNIPVDGAQ